MEPNNLPQTPPRPTTSLIVREFRHAHLHPCDRSSYKPRPFRETYYFFYGTLTDPSTLARVPDYPAGQKPQTHPAYIVGHPLKMWGECPAVLNKFAAQTTPGVAYKVKSREEATRLAKYETRMYRKKGCQVNLEDGLRVLGATFVWDADMALLREGSFDLGVFLEMERKREEKEKKGN